MKLYSKSISSLIVLVALFISCNEEEFLREEPLDFLSPENAFDNIEGYESSLVDLYAKTREIYFSAQDQALEHFYGTDMYYLARTDREGARRYADYRAIGPEFFNSQFHWQRWFKIINNANTVLERVQSSDLNESDRLLVEAEARFFRGFSYRHLVYMFGGVPILQEEIAVPRQDFTRASRTEVLQFIIEDAQFAAENLPGINEVSAPGRVPDLMAYHLLAETHVALEQWDQAINAATIVIDDSNTALMTTRFGSRVDEDFGDPYWDLFRQNNQNRNSGNVEGIWVAQMEVDVPGGLLLGSQRRNQFVFEREHVPLNWNITDPDGVQGMIRPEGRSDLNIGGRGVSFIRMTDWFINDLWESDFDNDIRNAPYNIVRDLIYTNPESNFFGLSAVENPGVRQIESNFEVIYPWLSKVTTPGRHPEGLYADPELLTLTNQGGTTYRDSYYLRLAETYLLRAEAHLGSGNQSAAANDINVVRSRANASLATPSEVNIDYILAERARELSFEEPRRLTLSRLGVLVERVRRFNPFNADDINDYNALSPIPAAEIEANSGGVLEQNPGY